MQYWTAPPWGGRRSNWFNGYLVRRGLMARATALEMHQGLFQGVRAEVCGILRTRGGVP